MISNGDGSRFLIYDRLLAEETNRCDLSVLARIGELSGGYGVKDLIPLSFVCDP